MWKYLFNVISGNDLPSRLDENKGFKQVSVLWRVVSARSTRIEFQQLRHIVLCTTDNIYLE